MSLAMRCDLLEAQARHQVVVRGLVVDVAGDVPLLEAADAVLEAGRAGDGPGPRQRLRVALERLKVAGSVAKFGVDLRQAARCRG